MTDSVSAAEPRQSEVPAPSAREPLSAPAAPSAAAAAAALDPSVAAARLSAAAPSTEPEQYSLAAPAEVRAALEAVLFVVDSPVSVPALASALQLPTGAVEEGLDALAADLDARGSGLELRQVAGGVRLYTRPAQARWVEAFLLDGQHARLTRAALETLAIIAYRQPVTRGRIAAIRGVNVDTVTRTLLSRGLIVESGADPQTGGGLLRTSELFLEKMGLNSLEELPSLAPLLPDLDSLGELDALGEGFGDGGA
ncbi:MAG: SMC-Scp complex subunit ScpB [Actinomycetia bacterium]|nr:SMC-Scp complex subunit ScpB [Actinomycetes bacterium]